MRRDGKVIVTSTRTAAGALPRRAAGDARRRARRSRPPSSSAPSITAGEEHTPIKPAAADAALTKTTIAPSCRESSASTDAIPRPRDCRN